MANLINQEGRFEYDNLIAGTQIETIVTGVKLKSGQGLLQRGSILAIDAADETASLATEDSEDLEMGILTDDINTNLEDEEEIISSMYIAGVFREKGVTAGEDTDITKLKSSLRKQGIYLV